MPESLFPALIGDLMPLGLTVLSIFIVAMASVYVLGRMLSVVKTQEAKNSVAFIVTLLASAIVSIDSIPIAREQVYEAIIVSSLVLILYVLVGFSLYDRADSFLDKHFGPDRPPRKKK